MKEKLQAGEALILDGKWEAAENHFESMKKAFPDDPDVLNNLGIVKEAIGRLREAEACFHHAIQSDPQHHNALLNLASLYARTARWRQASTTMDAAIAAGAGTTGLYNQMAVNYLNCGDTAKAKAALQVSLDLDANQPVVEKTLHQVREASLPANHEDRFSRYRASFVEFNITPPISATQPVLLQGIAGNPREAAAVEQPLMMQMLMLEDQHHTRVLLVTADIFGFDERMVNDIRRVGERWGIAPEGIILNASHTHYAPGTLSGLLPIMGHFYEDYADQLTSLIVKNIATLYHALESCRLYGSAAEAQIGINRRLAVDDKITFGPNPAGPYDRHTPFVVVDLCDSDRTILLASHGCHPTGMGALEHIASDYPGYFREALVAGGFADGVMFFQGAAGDIKQAAWHDQSPSFCASAKNARENGQRLASALVSALQNPVEPLSGSFFCTKATMPAMLKAPVPIHDMERQASQDNSNPLIRQWAQRFLPSVKSGDVSRELPIELQWVSLGEQLRFITFQGEPATMLAQRIRSLNQHPEGSFVLGYTNGLKAYLPTDAMIAEGGYEAELSHCVYPQPAGLESGIERQITSSIKRFSRAAERTAEPNGYGRYHLAQPSGKAFFVLSAGRCGTMTLARILNTADNARVWHHPQPDPIRESLLAYQGRIDKRATFWKMRQSVIQNTWAKGQIHGETDLLMTPFCDMLAEEIENAKFLLLVRHPADFVRSGMRRNYYCGHPWDVGRLRPSEGTADFEAWEEKDQFGKICWLWRETYARALQMKAAIGDDKVMMVRFEDLVGSTDSFRRLFDFLDLKGFDKDRIDAILSKKLNAQVSGDYAKPHAWSDALTTQLWDECGTLAERFGYGRLPETACGHDRGAISQPSPSTLPKVLILEAQGTSTGGHLDHIVAALNKKYDIKYIKTAITGQLSEAVEWADTVWLEWANQMAVHATNHIPAIKDKKVICRLHGYEVFTPYPGQIDWKVVDHLIFVAKHKQQLFKQKFGSIPTEQRLIRNGIDLSQFSVAAHKQNTKKLVLLGHLNFRKGLPLLLQFYHRLLKTDPTYYLYIRGEFQDPRLEMAAKTMIKELSLEKKLEFVDWVEDLNTWFADKSHILSFSLEESFHCAIGNGMAAGLKPVIHAWHESRDIWPSAFIFKDEDEFIDILARDDYDPTAFRHLLNEYGLSADVQIDQIDRLLSMASSQTTVAARGDNVANEHSNATIPLSIQSESPKTETTDYPVDSVTTMATQLQKQWLALSPHNDDEIQAQIDQLQSRGHVQTVKCERLSDYDGIWEVEFGIEANGSGLCLQFNVFDKIDNKFYCPFDIDDGLNEKLKQFAIDCIAAPHFKLGDNNRGKIHDQSLLTHIKENFQEYVWERMYPGTVFTPLGNFLKHMNRYRYVRQFLQPNSVVVDAACGIGYGSKYLSASCERIYGVDISSECLALSQKYYHAENTSWLKEDVTKLSIEDHSIDIFVSMETFEHLNSPENMLLEMRRCLKKDGYGFVSTPNGGSPKRKRVDNPYHTKEFTFAEMMTYGNAFFDQVSIFGVEENFQVVELSEENNHRFDNLLVVLHAES